MGKINIAIYNEFYHEQHDPKVAAVYPKGIHMAIAEALSPEPYIGKIVTATLDDHAAVLTQECLDDTDVLYWWGHMRHREVDDEVVRRVHQRVNDGMGLVVLHSGHGSKVFASLLGTNTGRLRWRESDDKCLVWVVSQGHPIVEGLPPSFEVPGDETYGEQFGIPEPDELIFISWFEGGEVFRSGCTFKRGAGKIFYYQNGHETYPIYFQDEVKLILRNAARWACPYQKKITYDLGGGNAPAKVGGRLER
jgi:trehalose utilization protein